MALSRWSAPHPERAHAYGRWWVHLLEEESGMSGDNNGIATPHRRVQHNCLRRIFYILTEHAVADRPRFSMEAAVIGLFYSVNAASPSEAAVVESLRTLQPTASYRGPGAPVGDEHGTF